MVCIYQITNLITGDFYIGQTINFENRIKAHKRVPPPKMRDDIKKYGWDNFKFEVIEECERGNLTERERYYIKTLNPAYNILPFGYEISEETRRKISQANLGKEVSAETREKISKAKKGKKFSPEHRAKIKKRMQATAVELFAKAVVCVETQEVFASMIDAAQKLGIKPQNLTAALHGRQKTAGGYTWKYADEVLNLSDDVHLSEVNRKLIVCVETGEIFQSITKAADAKGTTMKGISNVLHGKAITSGGFHWKYRDDRLNEKVRDEADRHETRKPVICVETGEIFQSIIDAANSFGIHASGIGDVLNGIKVTTGGYHWHYADGRPDKTREAKPPNPKRKKVLCVNTGQIFPSIKAASIAMGIPHSGISRVVNGRSKKTRGLSFKFFEGDSSNT